MRPTARQPRLRSFTRTDTPATKFIPRLVCAVCQFPGVPSEQEPGARLGRKPVSIEGTLYKGDADESSSTFDKKVDVIRQRGECPFCGAERFLDGTRGTGNRVPR